MNRSGVKHCFMKKLKNPQNRKQAKLQWIQGTIQINSKNCKMQYVKIRLLEKGLL
jgi:hypothetical protein